MNAFALTEMVDRVFAGRYRVEAVVGGGAISAVFAAVDVVEDRRVALKVFDEALAEDERFRARLFDAVEQSAGLDHPNLADILDWGVDGGPFIVSELCEGGSLASLLHHGSKLNPSQALVVALDCARGLNHGHEQGAIHRGLNPRNVLFSADQRVRITDYGLAAVLNEVSTAQSSRALENVRYASPEQARGRPISEATDLYSLALVINEAVTGEPPAVEETVVGTLMVRAELPAALDPALEGLLRPLERCGRVDPTERPEAEELAIALLASAETMPRPEALPLPDIANVLILDDYLRVAGGADGVDHDGLPSDSDISADPVEESASRSDPAQLDLDAAAGDDSSAGADDPVRERAAPGGDASAPGEATRGESALGGAALGEATRGEAALGEAALGEAALGEAALGDDFDVSVLGELDDFESFSGDDGDIDDPGSLDDLDDPGSLDDLDDPGSLDDLDDLDEVSNLDIPGDQGGTDLEFAATEEHVDPDIDALRAESSTTELSAVAPVESAGSLLDRLEEAEPVFAGAPAVGNELDVPTVTPTGRSARPAYEEVEDDAEDRLPWWPLAILVLLIGGVLAAGYFLAGIGQSDDSAIAPNVVGVEFDELVVESGVEVERLETRLAGSVPGTIVDQSPAAGEEFDDDRSLTVTVSLGEEMVELPSEIVGLTLEQATARLVSVGLNLGDLNEENSEELAAGLIIGLDEPTTQKPAGQSVALRVSLGPEARVVPNEIIGANIADAFSLLVGQRLQPVEEPAYSADQPLGTVMATIPMPGETVPADSSVTLIVSAGPEPVEMPDIVGLTLGEARDVIEELGLVFVNIEGTAGEDVIGSLPPIGAIADVGTEVIIILGDGDE